MSLFDVILVIIISAFALAGFWFGIVHTVLSMFGMVVGIYLAARLYEPAAYWVIHLTGWGANFSKVLLFIILFFVINRLVSLVFWLLDKFLSIFTHLPIIRSVDRLLGLAFGALEGFFVLGIILYFVSRFPLSDNFMSALSASVVAPYATKIIQWLLPLLPPALRALKSLVVVWL